MSTSVKDYEPLSSIRSDQKGYAGGKTGIAMWFLIAAAAVLFLR
jgi:hypothetical protein